MNKICFNSKQYPLVPGGRVPARCLDGPGWPLLDPCRPFFYFRDGETLMCFDVDANDCHEATIDDVAWIADLFWLLFDGERLVVVEDEDTLFAVQRLLSNRSGSGQGHETAGAGVALLDMARALAASSKVVVLTKALADSWQLPEGVNPHDIALWREAFGLGTGPRSVKELFEVASSTGTGLISEPVRELFALLLAWERVAVSQMILDTGSSQIHAFRASERVSELWATYVVCDRTNLKRSVPAQSAARCTAAANGDEQAGLIRVKVTSQDFLDESADVVFVTDTSGIEGTLRVDNIDWDPVEGFTATFANDPAGYRALPRFAELVSTGVFVAVVPKPDLSLPSGDFPVLRWAQP